MTTRTSAVLVLALLVLPARAQELLRDDFTRGLGKWVVADPALVRAADGVLRIGPGGALAAGDATWRDYRVSFRARTVEQPRGDGHWGIHVRAVPGPPEGELYIFARPERIALAGSGKTEWGFPDAPSFDSTEEHLYQLTVTDGQVDVEVDGRLLGSAHNIGNASGGVRFTAYNYAVEVRDVLIVALTPQPAVAEPVLPLDLPPGTAALDPAALAEHLDVALCNPTGLRRVDEPVVVPLVGLGFPTKPNLSSLVATDAATGAALPAQVDDLLGTGAIPAQGTVEARYGPELCLLVSLEPYSTRTVRLRYTAAPGAFPRPAGTVAGALADGKLTVTTPAYAAQFSALGGFTFQPRGFGRPLFVTRDPEGQTLVCRRVGPVRALVITRRKVRDNGLVTRVLEAWPGGLRVTATLAPEDRRHDAFVGPVEGFWFGLPMGDVQKLRYHTVDGFTEDPPGDRKPLEKLYAAPNALALDLVTGSGDVALVRRQRPDYSPSMGVIGWHQYAQGGLAFGWRPPVQVTGDQPHVQELWLAPHAAGMDAFRAMDRGCRRPVVVVAKAAGSPVGARSPRPSGGRPEGHAEAPARPTSLDFHERARQRAAEMGDLEAAASLPGHAELLFEAAKGARARYAAAAGANGKLDDYLAGEALLGKLDLPATARQIVQGLQTMQGRGAVPAGREAGPWRSLVGQARACAAAAAWDLHADHEERGIQRLARAARLYARARAYARAAPPRIAPAAPAGGLYPYVSFSEGADAKLAYVGFDVGHFWVPWGNHFEQLEVEPKAGQWDFSTTDKLFADAASSRMAAIPLLNFAPPRWWQKQFEPAKDAANAPPGSTGDARLVSPKLLGRVPPHMQAFGEYIRQMAARYGKGDILAWSVRNEPAYYETGGINGPLMREALDQWIRDRYATIAALNAVWGTQFAGFGSLAPPRKWEDNRAAWYDLMTFKAECLNGELSWEADLAMQSSPVRRSGAKFVPACSGPGAARSGFGVDPWLTAGAQRGVAFCDLYLDDPRDSALRAAELSWGAGGVPVISCETGPSSRPAGQAFRFHYLPARRARSFPWMMLGYGLYGTHYWTWSTNDEYGCLDWDGTLCDDGLEAALANREMQAVRPALAGLMPRVDLGFLYPRASFLQGDRAVLEAYARSYAALAQAGYQVRLVAPSDFDRAAPSLSHLFVPPAPYLESAVVERLTRYVSAGGTLLVCGEPGRFDEYARPRPGGLRALTGAGSDAGRTVGKGRVYRLDWDGDAASADALVAAALRRAGAPRSLSTAPAGVSQRVLAGPKGERYLVVSNLSGAEARWEVTVYGTAGGRPAYVDLLTGERVTAKRARDGLVVSLALEAEGARLIRLDAGR